MPLTMRPYSANVYALSKVWFKCCCINLRSQDIIFINKQVKSWLYQDCLEKPSELVLYRDSKDGGLGLFHVHIRSLALLIRAFLETSVNPSFRHSLFHEALYRFHVLDDISVPDPGLTPYYDNTFFNIIKHYKNNSSMNTAVLSTRQWYRLLLEDRVLMSQEDGNSVPTLLPIRPELLHHNSDWPNIWARSKTKGLGSDLSSFLFRLLHQLLPTQERVQRIMGNRGQEPAGLCLLCRQEREDLQHAFFFCQESAGVGLALLGYVQHVVSTITPEECLRLEIGDDLGEEDQLAVVCLLASGLKYIWETRAEKKVLSLHKMRAEIEAGVFLLRKTRYAVSGDKMNEMIN